MVVVVVVVVGRVMPATIVSVPPPTPRTRDFRHALVVIVLVRGRVLGRRGLVRGGGVAVCALQIR